MDLLFSPLDVLKPNGANLASPHPVGVQQLEDGKIAPAHRSRAIDAFEYLLGVLLGQSTRNVRQLIAADRGHGLRQIALEVSLLISKAE